jgi:hypothetical protein
LFRRHVDAVRRREPNRVLTRWNVPAFLAEVWHAAHNPVSIRKGAARIGAWPLDVNWAAKNRDKLAPARALAVAADASAHSAGTAELTPARLAVPKAAAPAATAASTPPTQSAAAANAEPSLTNPVESAAHQAGTAQPLATAVSQPDPTQHTVLLRPQPSEAEVLPSRESHALVLAPSDNGDAHAVVRAPAANSESSSMLRRAVSLLVLPSAGAGSKKTRTARSNSLGENLSSARVLNSEQRLANLAFSKTPEGKAQRAAASKARAAENRKRKRAEERGEKVVTEKRARQDSDKANVNSGRKRKRSDDDDDFVSTQLAATVDRSRNPKRAHSEAWASRQAALVAADEEASALDVIAAPD